MFLREQFGDPIYRGRLQCGGFRAIGRAIVCVRIPDCLLLMNLEAASCASEKLEAAPEKMLRTILRMEFLALDPGF